MEKEIVKKIDMHVHTTETMWYSSMPNHRMATPKELMKLYETIGVEAGVLLPCNEVECGYAPSSNYEVKCIVDKYPGNFYWFCNLDARQGDNSPENDFTPYIQYMKSMGAKGVGEYSTNLYMDHPMMLNFFKHCALCDMPVVFHMGNLGHDYGIVDDFGLPKLEKVLSMFPNLKLIGHSQKFWAEISGDLKKEDRDGYPTGKIVPGGRLVELMRNYPNLYADLSAGSGYNAMTRDPSFSYGFLEEFQDRLYYGTDICSPTPFHQCLALSGWLDEAMQKDCISYEAYVKVARGNAIKLLTR